MQKDQYWKNFKLGKELDISGSFIYNGLRSFHEMQTLYHEEEAFEFLYSVSVGLERLLKICVILIEHNNTLDQKEFEKSLITHNLLTLLNRVKAKHVLTLHKPHNEFLHVLTKFYKSYRYEKYNLSSLTIEDTAKASLNSYLEKNLEITIDNNPMFAFPNDKRIKRFIGKIIGKISEELFQVVQTEAGELNIYTYEMRYESKASKVFQCKQYDFIKEEYLAKELLIYFLSKKATGDHTKLIKDQEPLEFDPALESDYISGLLSDTAKLQLIDELDSLQEDIDNIQERESMLDAIGYPHLDLGDEE